MQPITPAESHGRIRKGLRKGTHSCLECRRRKVRCIFDSNTPRCRECQDRGAQCTRQNPELRPASPQEDLGTLQRVRDLEALVSRIIKAPPTPNFNTFGAAGGIGSEATANPSAAVSNPTRSQALAYGPGPPALSLFDNTVLCRYTDDERLSHDTQSKLSAKSGPILRELKCFMPNAYELSLILQQSTDSWRLWQMTFPEMLGSGLNATKLRDFVYTTINSLDLGLVVKISLCLAIHIQQLPSHFVSMRLNLPLSLQALQERYMDAAQSLLESDEELAGTFEGLACMLIQSEYYINAGKPRKVWLILRRAISFAQLLGVHHPSDEADHPEATSRHSLFVKLWLTDRELSLILGLPYAVPDSFLGFEFGTIADITVGVEERFLLKLGVVSGRMIHRNQNRRKMAYSATLEIDQELEECHDMMSEDWWQPLPRPDLSPEELFTMLTVKLKYFNVRKLLHLPFMLKAYGDRRYESSRYSTLEAARDMIRTYQILRGSDGSLLKMCEMVDFEVFTAAMILVINLLTRAPDNHTLPQQPLEDWEIVRSLASDLRRISAVVACHVAQQAAQLLEDFYNAHQTHSLGDNEVYEATIPYFGKFNIRRRVNTVAPASSYTAVSQHNSSEYAPVAPDPQLCEAPFMTFEDYLHCASDMFQTGQNINSAWLSNSAVDDGWMWMPNSTGMQ